MSLTNAMLVGFTGVNANTAAIDTVGNNLANLNTTAFKGQRALFETLLYQTIDEGEAPSANSGGSLPRQIGLGAGVATLQRNFGQGGMEDTGFAGDVALDGDGFFVLAAPDGSQVYTRDGSFRLDATQTLVSSNGSPLQVFAADSAGAIDTGSLSDLVVPLGSTGVARATTQVVLDGRLDSGTEIASGAAVVTSDPLVTANGAPATDATALTDLVNPFGVSLFTAGDELAVTGRKGGANVADSTFIVGTTGNTVGDLAAHLATTLGINSDPTTGNAAGVTVSDGTDAPVGSLVITSNLGEINAIELDGGSVVNQTGVVTSPLAFTTTSAALGGGIDTTTSFNVFDSLGNPVDVRIRMAMESKSDAGTVWRFYAESNGDSDLSPILGTGTITFDTNGRFVSATGTDLSIDLAGAGSTSPMTFALDFSRLTGLASADGSSEVSMTSQDGTTAGIMTGFSIGEDGVVTAVFSNQDELVLGQVALATFPSNEGLVALSDNTFAIGPNSGDVTLTAAQSGKAGTIRSGFLEQANVEIAREFVNLISASTGVSAASRVVRASDDLLQELLLLAR